MLPIVDTVEGQHIEAGGGSCLLAGRLGIRSASLPTVPAPLSCASGGAACALCAAKAGCSDAPQAVARPACVNTDVLQEMLYKNLLWRQ